MGKAVRNNGNGANKLVSQLAAEKKKTVFAVCLITLMVFMWVRVFSKKTPQSAGAAPLSQMVTDADGQLDSESKISFIELPKVSGRNDVLSRDFFASNGWRNFLKGREGGNLTGVEEVNVISGKGGKEVIRQVAEKLRLEAIMLGERPQAFINDVLLSVGDKLAVKDGDDTYECEVSKIEGSSVFIRCGGAEIQLKLAEAIEVNG